MKYTYSIVYKSEFVEISENGLHDYQTYKEAKLRLSFMDNKNELTIVKVSDDDLYCREGSRWEKLS